MIVERVHPTTNVKTEFSVRGTNPCENGNMHLRQIIRQACLLSSVARCAKARAYAISRNNTIGAEGGKYAFVHVTDMKFLASTLHFLAEDCGQRIDGLQANLKQVHAVLEAHGNAEAVLECAPRLCDQYDTAVIGLLPRVEGLMQRASLFLAKAIRMPLVLRRHTPAELPFTSFVADSSPRRSRLNLADTRVSLADASNSLSELLATAASHALGFHVSAAEVIAEFAEYVCTHPYREPFKLSTAQARQFNLSEPKTEDERLKVYLTREPREPPTLESGVKFSPLALVMRIAANVYGGVVALVSAFAEERPVYFEPDLSLVARDGPRPLEPMMFFLLPAADATTGGQVRHLLPQSLVELEVRGPGTAVTIVPDDAAAELDSDSDDEAADDSDDDRAADPGDDEEPNERDVDDDQPPDSSSCT